MSGGSYCYIGDKLSEQCEGRMYDDVMNEMIHDLCDVLHDLEFSFDEDVSDDDYMKKVSNFKKKWIKKNKINGSYKKIISKEIRDIIDAVDKAFIEIFATNCDLIKVISFYENKGYEILKWKKKKVVMYEPFDNKEVHLYYKYNKDCTDKIFTGIKFK